MWQIDTDILRVSPASNDLNFIDSLANRTPFFVLTVAYTDTVQIPGVSGAGVTTELRELTAQADAEIMAHGKARCLPGGVPSNPTGAPGPSIITRAAFDLLPDMGYVCVDAGLKSPPDVPGTIFPAGAGPARAVTTGQALGPDESRAGLLFSEGLRIGRELGRANAERGYLILAESVPGGTTTALGVLLGLGLDAEQRVSSSMPGNNTHELKLQAVRAGLAAFNREKGAFARQPLGAAASLGDPMQPVVAGMALAASQFCPVVLAGGTQMAAVLALAAAIYRFPGSGLLAELPAAQFERIALVTTGWVANDPGSDLAGLAAEIETSFGPLGSPYFAANLDFSGSAYPPVQLYEAGYVKEGVGAGAAALAAMLATGCTAKDLNQAIEAVYRRIVLNEGH
ncbi:MAG: hypothetical protein JWP00_336 [Chloroflexi bacterium]|jgi:uncharacterized protein (TIGR00303 family)|nr:hypothetical protein [Chloroflexota bacterium]